MALLELAWSPLANTREKEYHKASLPPDAQGGTHPMLLDGYIGKVDEHVVQLAGARGILHCAESAEAKLVPGRELRLRHGTRGRKYASPLDGGVAVSQCFQFHYVALANLTLMTSPSLPPECWDFKSAHRTPLTSNVQRSGVFICKIYNTF